MFQISELFSVMVCLEGPKKVDRRQVSESSTVVGLLDNRIVQRGDGPPER